MNEDHHPVGRPSGERRAMSIDRAELRKRAEEATGGTWSLFIPDRGYCSNYIVTDLPERAPDEHHRFRHVVADYDDCGKGELDAMFAVAAQPSTVLALLDRIEELEGRVRDIDKEASDARAIIGRHKTLMAEAARALDETREQRDRARKALSGEKP